MTDAELRHLLHDAVADVEPTRTADDVRATDPASRRGWLPLTVAAAVVTTLILAGVPWLAGRDGDAPPAAAPADQVAVVAYAVVDTPQGQRLAADRRTVEGTGDPLLDALNATLGDDPADPGYRPVLASSGFLEMEVDRTAEQVAITLRDPNGGLREATRESLDQLPDALHLTVAQALGDSDVEVRVLAPDSIPIDRTSSVLPLERLAPITIESVGADETVPQQFTVSGLATAFEGTVAWRLLDGKDVVREGFTTAQECCTPSPYSFDVDAPPGEYVLEVGETDPSGGEGFPAYVDTKRLTVE